MDKAVTLYELIERSAKAALDLQGQDGTMPPGHNGPWNDPETPLRNTGYWLITFLKAYKITGSQKYLESAQRAADFLASDAARPGGGAFWHRNNPKREASNGLIGQAWTIEALASASEQLDRPELGKLAEGVFLRHRFDASRGLWSKLNVDGTRSRLSRTFNQQIWFAAAGSMVARLPQGSTGIGERVHRFLDHLPQYLHFDSRGIFNHVLDPMRLSRRRHFINLRSKQSGAYKKRTDLLAVGYHTFNMYGLALLNQTCAGHPFWENKSLPRMWESIISQRFNQLAENNPYSYRYNPSGIEIAFALFVFRPDLTDLRGTYLAEQFRRWFNFKTNFMEGGGAGDPLTLAARLYEATRLPDCLIFPRET